jgi:hypothetical protein
VRQMSGVNVIDELVEVCCGRTRLQIVVPAVERELSIVKEHFAAVHDAANSQIDSSLPAQVVHASVELVQESAADQTRADDSDLERLAGEVERGMQCS